MNYRASGPEVIAAWFVYKESNPDSRLSVRDFVAGYNAALSTFKTAAS